MWKRILSFILVIALLVPIPARAEEMVGLARVQDTDVEDIEYLEEVESTEDVEEVYSTELVEEIESEKSEKVLTVDENGNFVVKDISEISSIIHSPVGINDTEGVITPRAVGYPLTINCNGGKYNSQSSLNLSPNITLGNASWNSLPVPTRDGYTFKGWYSNSSGGTQIWDSAGKAITGNGFWVNNGNGIQWVKEYADGTAITVYAQWTANTYTVTWYPGDGLVDGNSYPSGIGTTIVFGTSTINQGGVTATRIPLWAYGGRTARTGYTHKGWYDATSGGNQVFDASGNYKTNGSYWNSSGNWSKASNTGLYAQWTANTYSVVYNANGGSGSMSNSSHTYNTAKALTANAFTKTGYTFNGWNTKSDGSGTSYSNKASVKNLTSTSGGKVNLYAKWKANSYTVAYNANGGSGTTMTSSSHTYDTAKALTANSYTRTGYTFNGWNTKSDGSGTSYANKASVKNLTSTSGGTVTLYAQWKGVSYSVAYNGNGSTSGSMSNSSHTYGTAKALTANAFSKTGYTFNGWNTKSDGSGTSYANKASVSNLTSTSGGTVNLYAKWKANTYTVVYDANGGSGTAMSNSSHTYDTAKALTANSYTKTGYTFSGWNTKADGSGTSYANKASVKNLTTTNGGTVTLYAQWSVNSYTQTIVYRKWSKASDSWVEYNTVEDVKPYGYSYSLSYGTAPTGYYAYSKSDDYTVSGNATKYVNFYPVKYYISYNANGGSGDAVSSTCYYDLAEVLKSNAYTRTGYTFIGWNTKADGSGTSYSDGAKVKNLSSTEGATVKLYAQWRVNELTFTYHVNGGTVDSSTYSVKDNMVYKGDVLATNVFYYTSTKMDCSNIGVMGIVKTGYAVPSADLVYIVEGDSNFIISQNEITDVEILNKFKEFIVDGDATIVLKPNWKAMSYTVTLELGGGECSNTSVSVVYDSEYGELPTPTKEGYIFKGWFTAVDDGVEVTSSSVVTNSANHTLYARWVEDEAVEKDVTDVYESSPELNHECSNYLVSKYDNNNHWNECSICGSKVGVVAHTLVDNGWTQGSADYCISNNVHSFSCSCGYSYSTTEGKKEHNYSISENDAWQFVYRNKCSGCSATIASNNHACILSDGSRITCVNLGTCSICGYKYTAKRHFTNNASSNVGKVLHCDVCSKNLGIITKSSTLVVNSDGNLTFSGSAVFPSELTFSSLAPYNNMGCSMSDVRYTVENNILTFSYDINYKSVKEVSGYTRLYITFSGSDGYTYRIRFYNSIQPEKMPPTISSIIETNTSVVDGWSLGKILNFSGTENYCNSVKLTLKDSEGNTYLNNVSASVVGGKWSYSFTPNIEADMNGKVLTLTVTDALGNYASKTHSISKVDRKAPTSSAFSTETEWSKSKELVFTATDAGIGQVEVSFDNQNEYYKMSSKDSVYSKKYIFVGDVYGTAETNVYFKDGLGNLSYNTVKISNLDNTKPTINDFIVVRSGNGLKVTINANDINTKLGKEGSGVVACGYSSSNSSSSVSWLDGTSLTINNSGKYYLFVKDRVGNISDSVIINISSVLFDANCGTVATESKLVYTGLEYGELPTPIREGYIFSGWYTAKEGGNLIESNSIVTNSGDHVLYSRWVLSPITVSIPKTVILDSQGQGSIRVSSNNIKSGTLKVIFDSIFDVQQTNKGNVRVTLSSDSDTITKSNKYIIISLNAEGLSAGPWYGKFNIGIEYNE